MKIAGIIAEYNPFHAGHAYHIQRTRARTGCDYVVCVMSGAFTQRGEPALIDKFARVECALLSGADAVFELPAMYAARPAQYFARGGVGVLSALGVDYISFGLESALEDELGEGEGLSLAKSAAALAASEPAHVSQAVREGLGMGKSHARARGEALALELGVPAEALNKPNFILATEYLRALSERKSDITPVAIARRTEYHSEALTPLPSALAIRRAILAGCAGDALAHVPETARGILAREIARGVSSTDALNALLLYTLRAMTKEQVALLEDAGEGLGERLHAFAQTCISREALIESVKCKRYTRARISRVCLYALTGLTAARAQAAPAPYARLLGFRADAGACVKELSLRAKGKIVPGAKALKDDPLFAYECRATDLWGLTTPYAAYLCAGRERTQKFIVV